MTSSDGDRTSWERHLASLGLSESAVTAYLALADGAVPDAAALAELRERFLVTETLEPVPIRMATSLWVARRQVDLAEVEALGRQLGGSSSGRELPGGSTSFIDVISGLGPVTTAFREVQESAQERVRIFDRPPYLRPQGVAMMPVQPAVMARGVSYRTIYHISNMQDERVRSLIAEAVEMGEEARFHAEIPMRMALVDDARAMLMLPHPGLKTGDKVDDQRNINAVLVHASPFLDALSRLFETTWTHSVPFVASDEKLSTWGIDAVDQRILELMNTGLTDARIAHVVGISERTVARRVNRMLERVGAPGRFALGVRAVQDGLL
ncbi:LuxR C-terminal-related transcriptional regulator [Nocardioides sp. GXZ039]|uniref:LuxR C-terminal-related transcriptional regulator n=1 Tax=Nocardioides sp. GXZ039 TaxID=3136018 RepID=UPI0030F423C9